ncbi:MAG: FAD-dependent oxidoreductase, partial [Oscillatoriales cyanobacterium C42_A2020_001]|nr:FAD-dependent oxidoreductase [Leptolyngbyaceae cyanobacterium C42_A2020_001]
MGLPSSDSSFEATYEEWLKAQILQLSVDTLKSKMDKLHGAGVYYGAAMTEAIACQGETVYIVGGANSAGQAAMYFSKYAQEVVMLVRSPLSKSMSQYLIDQIEATTNINVCTECVVEAVKGEANLEALIIGNLNTGEVQTVNATSLFIFIGAMPQTHWLDGIVERDERGFILTGPDLISAGQFPAALRRKMQR